MIGRGGDAALRRLNGHLHRVEVPTFEQPLRIAENVLGDLQTRSPGAPGAGDTPF